MGYGIYNVHTVKVFMHMYCTECNLTEQCSSTVGSSQCQWHKEVRKSTKNPNSNKRKKPQPNQTKPKSRYWIHLPVDRDVKRWSRPLSAI